MPKNLISRGGFGRPARVSPFIFHTQAETGVTHQPRRFSAISLMLRVSGTRGRTASGDFGGTLNVYPPGRRAGASGVREKGLRTSMR